jgi:hypothetical protein
LLERLLELGQRGYINREIVRKLATANNQIRGGVMCSSLLVGIIEEIARGGTIKNMEPKCLRSI